MNSVLLVSLEGLESNTEINFFNGLNMHSKFSIFTLAIGKVSEEAKLMKNFKGRIKLALSKNNYSECKIFFIGDNDVSKDLVSMERAKNVFIEFCVDVLEFDKSLINDKIIYPGKGIDFDTLLINVHKESRNLMIHDKHKSKSNYDLFNNFAEKAKWFDGDRLNSKKIKEDLERVKTDYILIFNAILEP